MAFGRVTTSPGSGGVQFSTNIFTDTDSVIVEIGYSQLVFGPDKAIPTVVDSTHGLPVAVLGAVASQIADGASVALGAMADTAAGTDTGTFSLIGLFKRLLSRLTTFMGQLPTALTGGGNLKVAVSESTITQAVSAVSLPLPGGAATAANQATEISGLAAIFSALGSVLLVNGSGVTQPVSGTFWQSIQPVSGTFWQATQPVSAATLPLPAGASTSALQTTGNTSLASILSALQGTLTVSGTVAATGTFWQAIQPVSGTFWQATQPVSAASLPLPAGASTSALQTTGNTSLASILSALEGTLTVSGTVGVTGTFWQATQPISAVSLPLPTGASTAANQTTGNTSLASILSALQGTITVNGSGVTQPVSGTFWQATQPVSAASLPLPAGASTAAKQDTSNTSLASIDGKLTACNTGAVTISAALPAGTNLLGKVGIDQTTPGTTNAIVPTPVTSGGPTKARIKAASGTNATNVKNAAGQVYGWYLFNAAAAIRVVHIYDSASAPTAGSGTPAWTVILPIGGGANVEFSLGIPMASGIGYTITSGASDTDTGSCSADDVHGILLYK